jgi:rhamnosyltransferase
VTADAAVVIRCRDEAQWLGRVLDAVLDQTTAAEILVVDSGSRDGSVAIARSRGVRVEEISAGAFTYGRALNLGFGWTQAPLVACLSAHALPADRHWLERLVAPFVDPSVAATYGRHLPHADLDPFRRRMVLDYWTAQPRVDAPRSVRFSNANSAVRRSAWERFPWDERLRGAEDKVWAETVTATAAQVVYVPEACVYHSHREGARAVYRRNRAEAKGRDVALQPTGEALRRYASTVRGDLRLVAGHPRDWRWAWWSPVFRAAEILGERAGTRGG